MSSGGMNDQFDQMNQMRNASRDVRREGQRMSDLMSEQISQMREMVRSTGSESADQFRDRQKEIRQQMKSMKRYYRQNSKYLNQADKQAYKAMYKNRRRDLRDLEREARYRFRDIEEEGLDAFENIGNKVQEIAESLRDWKVAIDVGNISEGVQDSVATVFESQKRLQQLTGQQLSELRSLSDSFRQRSKETGNKIGADEYMAGATSLAEMGYKDLAFLEDMGKVVTEISHATGFATDDMKKLAEYADTIGNSDMAYQFGNIAKTISEDATLYTSATDLMQTFEDTFDSVNEQAAGDIDKFNAMMKDQFSLKSLTSALYLNDYHDELYNMVEEIRKGNTDTITQISSLGLNGYDLQKMAQGGDYTGAVENILKAIQQNYGSMNDNLKTYLSNEFGFNDEMMRAINSKDLSGIDQINSSIAQAYSSAEGTDSLANYIDNEVISPLEKMKNWFANSKLGSAIEQFMGETGLSTTELLMGINAVGGIVGKLGSLGKGIGKLFGGGSGSGGGLGSMLSGGASAVGNFFRAGFGGAGANTAAGAAGMNILGFGAPGGMATLGAGGAMSAGLLATGAMGVGGIALTAKDAIGGVNKSEEWLGSNSTGDKVKSGIGGALGGTGPGIGQGSAIDTAKNIGGGALKGAALGGAIGSIIPGLGTAVGAAVGGAVGAIGSAIGGERIAKAIDWMGDKLGDVWEGTKEIAGKAWEGIKGFAGKAWDGIKSTASNAWEGIKGFASNAWTKAKNFGIDAFNTAVGVGDMAMEGLFNAMGLDWDGFKGKVSEGWSNIKEWGSNAWTGIKDWAGEKWDEISGKATEIWDGISTKASEVWTGITDWASEKWNGFKDTVSEGWDTIKEWGTNAWTSVSDWANEKWDDIKDTASGVWDSVSTKASGVWDSVKSGAEDAFDAVKDKASDIWGGIKDFFSGAKERGEEITGVEGSHKNGLDYVPHDGYIAELHKGETVLTAKQADEYRNRTKSAASSASKSDTAMNNQNGKSVKSWFSKMMKQVAPTLQKPVVGSSLSSSSGDDTVGTSSPVGNVGNFYLTDKFIKMVESWEGFLSRGTSKDGGIDVGFGFHNQYTDPNGKTHKVTYDTTMTRKYAEECLIAEMKGELAKTINKVKNTGWDPSKFTNNQMLALTSYFFNRGFGNSKADQLLSKSNSPSIESIGNNLPKFWGSASYAKEGLINRRNKEKELFFSPDAGVKAAYKQGTPWVPDTQVALLHKGEAVIPAENNPVNTGTKAELSTSKSDSSMSSGDVKEIVNVIKWMVNRLEKKLDETAGSNDNFNNIQINNQSNDRVRKSDAVFQF